MENVEDRIRERAHLIWEREGRPVGRELAHWEMAAAELSAEDRKSASPKKTGPRKLKVVSNDGEEVPAKKPRAARTKPSA